MELKKEMLQLSIKDIRPNPAQARTHFDEGKLKILADSIKEIGINTPMQLMWEELEKDKRKATIVDGERRFRACGIAGKKNLKYGEDYIYVAIAQEDIEYRGLIANCMRENLQPVDKARAFLQLMKRRGIKNINVATNVVNRAKDYKDNNFLSEPSKRNYFISKEIVKQVAIDMKTIGVSGTNGVDLLKLLKLPNDIQRKIVFAPPNSKIYKEKMKMSRHGELIKRVSNDRGEVVPMSFGRELARLDNEKITRFLLRKAIDGKWTVKKLCNMVSDYIGSSFTPERYIEEYSRSQRAIRTTQRRIDEIGQVITQIDSFASMLTSFRTINLYAMAERFKQKSFQISSVGLHSSTKRLGNALEQLILTTKEIAKLKETERKQVLKLPFRVRLSSTAKSKKPAYRFSIPIEIGRKIEAEVGELREGLEIELQINAVIVEKEKE